MGAGCIWLDEGMTISNLCLALFLLLQAADISTTTYGIRNGLKEANPIMRLLIAKLGLYVGQLAIRLPIIAMVSYFALTGGLEEWAMIALVVPFLVLLINNLYWIRKSYLLK